jgi:hypothetical protein
MGANKFGVGLAMALAVGVSGPAQAALKRFNVDFGAAYTLLPSSYGAASGQPGAWNDIVALGATTGLLDAAGTPTGVSITVTGQSFGSAGSGATDDEKLLGDLVFQFGGAWSVVFAGLDNGNYDVYYYAPEHPMPAGEIVINGAAVPSLQGNIGTLEQGVSWDVLRGVAVTDGLLTLAGSPTPGFFSGLAGVQIAEAVVPIPAALWLLGSSLALLMGVGRRPG